MPPANTLVRWVNEKRLRPRSAGSTLPHLWPTCSSSGWPPLTTARYFSSCPSDSRSLWTPCPPVLVQPAPRSALAVSGFRLRARLGFSIPPCFPGQRGITPAFGYGAPHPSVEGTSTPMTHALPSAHYGPLRHPNAPGLSLTGVRLIIPVHALGLPVLRALSLCTCCRHYPGAALGVLVAHTQPCQPSPEGSPGRPAHRPFRDPMRRRITTNILAE